MIAAWKIMFKEKSYFLAFFQFRKKPSILLGTSLIAMKNFDIIRKPLESDLTDIYIYITTFAFIIPICH